MKTAHRALALCSLLAACGQGTNGRAAQQSGPSADDPPIRILQVPDLGSGAESRPIVGPPPGKPLAESALNAALVDERERPRSLAADAGKVRVLSFFFRCCSDATMCPQLTSLLSDSTGRLSPEERDQVRGFLVSFDPERDTPERLRAYAQDIRANAEVLSLLTGKIEEVRKLTEACGVNFMPGENKDIVHNMRTVVLDRDGNVTEVFRGADFEAGKLLGAIRAALRGEKPSQDPQATVGANAGKSK